MTSRDVSINLTVKPDPNSKEEVGKFKREVERMLNAGKDASGIKLRPSDFVPLIKSASDYKRLQQEIGANAVASFEEAKETVIELAESFEQARQGYAVLDKFVTDNTRKTFDALDSAWRSHLRKQEGLRRQADERMQREEEKAGREALKKRLELYKEEKAKREALAEKAAATYERAQTRQAVATREFREALSNTLGGIQSITRGMVTMGVLGEESSERMHRGLLKVYAVMDIFQGGITTINHLSRAMAQYRLMTDLAAKSQLALAAATKATQAAGAVGAAGAAGGAAVGSAAGAATGAAAGAAGGAAGAGAASAFGAVRAAISANAVLLKAAGVAAAADIAAAAGVYLASHAIANIGNNKVGGFNDRWGGSGWNPFTKTIRLATGDDRRLNASNASLARAQDARASIQERGAELEQQMLSAMQEEQRILGERIDEEKTIFDLKAATLTNDQKIAAITKAEAKERREIANYRRRASQDEFNDGQTFMALAEKHQARLKELAAQRGDIEREIAQRKAQTAREALSAAKQELDKVTDRIKAEQQAYMSAQERFGFLSRDQQQAALGALVKARRGGSLSSEELGSLQSLGTGEAGRLASAQARARVAGDYSEQQQRLAAINNRIAQAKREMRDLDEPITGRDIRNRRTIERDREIRRAQLRDEINALIGRERGIEGGIARDQALRNSLFGDERRGIAQAVRDRNRIDAKIHTQIQVVANFDKNAQQVAEAVNRQLLALVQPFTQNVQQKLEQLQGQVNSLGNQRKNLGARAGGK